jgi:anti-sigma regulatory factor (Ser/Thr protein kinase)
MTVTEQRTFAARLDSLPATVAFVEAFCAHHAVARSAALRVAFIIEELFTNTILHGHGADADSPIRVTLSIRDAEVALLYEDAAPRYDPMASWTHAPSSLGSPLESRAVGGLGAYLVSRFVTDARYAYEEGFNRLWLLVRWAE